MPGIIFSSAAAFVSTNLDDLLVLALLFAQAETAAQRRRIYIGQYAGAGVLIAVSWIIAAGMGRLPYQCISLLGIVPILLGLRLWLNRKEPEHLDMTAGICSVFILCLSNGADNIGIYVPLLTGTGPVQMAVFVVMYTLLLALWFLLAQKLLCFPVLGQWLRRGKDILVPIVYILLGLSLLLDAYIL